LVRSAWQALIVYSAAVAGVVVPSAATMETAARADTRGRRLRDWGKRFITIPGEDLRREISPRLVDLPR
jgi:hypothetical protein